MISASSALVTAALPKYDCLLSHIQSLWAHIISYYLHCYYLHAVTSERFAVTTMGEICIVRTSLFCPLGLVTVNKNAYENTSQWLPERPICEAKCRNSFEGQRNDLQTSK